MRLTVQHPRRKSGFVLVATGVCIAILVGCMGLAVDLGRMYVIKSEVQSWADAASINAALQLDGTRAGLNNAANAVSTTAGKWEFGTKSFTSPTVLFALTTSSPWYTAAAAPLNSSYARVTVTVPVSLYFLPAVTGSKFGNVSVRATAAQVAKTTFSEGLFPFSPYMHDSTGPNFGLVAGRLYTLRWPANPKLGNGGNVCDGDRIQNVVALANAAGGSERGYIEDTSAALIAATIIDDYQSITRTVGDIVDMTGGAKQSQLRSLETRIRQDSDTVSTTYAEYVTRATGNGRRVVACPINDGGTPAGSNNRIVGIGAFFLYPTGEYGTGGNQAWCAEYIGSWVEGTDHAGANGGGAYVVRIVE